MGATAKIEPINVDIQSLQESLLFKGSPIEVLEFAAGLMEEMRLDKGDPVFLENETSQFVYFIRQGSVEIVRFQQKVNRIVRLKVLKEGGHFSEMSVLTGSSHSTSAFALEPLILHRLERSSFETIFGRFPEIAKKVVISLAELTHQMTHSAGYFATLQEDQLHFHPLMPRLISLQQIQSLGILPVAIRQRSLVVGMLNPKNEAALQQLKKSLGEFTIKILAINPQDFARLSTIVRQCYETQQPARGDLAPQCELAPTTKDLASALRSSDIFSTLSPALIDQIVPHLKIANIKAGQLLFAAKSPSDHLFLIYKGAVEISKVDASGVVPVATVGDGDGLSEVSLILGKTHSLQATATEDTILIVLDRHIFTQLLTTSPFCLALARIFAHRLQDCNRGSNLAQYDGTKLDLAGVGHLIPRSVVAEHEVVPLYKVGDELTVGITSPDDDSVYTVINRYLPAFRIKFVIIKATDFSRWLENLDSNGNKAGSLASASRVVGGNNLKDRRIDGDPSILFDSIIAGAIGANASDIHLEPTKDAMTVRYRVDGALQELASPISKSTADKVTSRIKIMCTMDIAERRLPQDGQLEITVNGNPVQARVSSLPTKFGEKIMIRLMKSQQNVVPLNMLVPDRALITTLRHLLKYKQGMILVSGPTGSGKTTTLYSMLSELNRADRNIVTIEDPVEAVIQGLTQVEINPEIDLTFSRALKAVLRQDPNIIMLGEIRDAESAAIAFQAALTGHLVLSTIHTNSSLDIEARLRDLGVQPSIIASSLVGVLAQRLVKAVCKRCARGRPLTDKEKALFVEVLDARQVPPQVYEAVGCEACLMTGYKGRVPIIEAWHNSAVVRTLLNKGAELDELKSAVMRDGFKTIGQFGFKMVASGLTTLDEVEKNLYGLV